MLLAPYPAAQRAAGAAVVRGAAGMAGRPPAGHAAHPAPPRHHRPGRAAGRAARHHPAARRGQPGRAGCRRWRRASPTPSPTWPSRPRRLLPAVSLFHGVADEAVLAAFSAADGVPDRFAGASKQEWTAVLEDAARVGLLTGLGAGMYRIHPALPGYLAAALARRQPRPATRQERQAAEQALRAACAAFSQLADRADRIRGRRPRLHAHRVATAHPGAMLGHALDHRAWDDAERHHPGAGWVLG